VAVPALDTASRDTAPSAATPRDRREIGARFAIRARPDVASSGAPVLAGGPTVEAGIPGALVARLGVPGALFALAGGGALVGFGTAACGGRGAGHGLTGCARLSPASLVATASFFAAAVATSLLLGRGA
jgi:hypothetical protein